MHQRSEKLQWVEGSLLEETFRRGDDGRYNVHGSRVFGDERDEPRSVR